MPRPCHDLHDLSPATCPLCEWYTKSPFHRSAWDNSETKLPPSPATVALPCVYFGESLSGRERDAAGLSHGRDWHYCNHAAAPIGKHVCHCQGCNRECIGYTAPLPDSQFEKVSRRNLLFFIHPIAGNGVWQRRVIQLRQRMPLFNGKRIVAITTGGGLDNASEVRTALDGLGCEFVEVPNDASLREVAAFEPMFSRVESTDPTEATLFAHAKGVTRPPMSAPQAWGDVLFATHCDYWQAVESVLLCKPIAGCFKKFGRGFAESESEWHYSGSWFWFRNAELFSRNWRKIDLFWAGIEPYPSLHFSDADAGSIFMEGNVNSLNLYDSALWESKILPAWKLWQEVNANNKTKWN